MLCGSPSDSVVYKLIPIQCRESKSVAVRALTLGDTAETLETKLNKQPKPQALLFRYEITDLMR